MALEKSIRLRHALVASGLLGLAGFAGSVAADCGETAETTIELNDCAKQEFDRAEARLNTTWKQVMARLDERADEPDATAAKTQLRDAQRTWVKFREQDCQAVYTLYQGGTMRTLMHLGCLTGHADRRTKDLEEWLAEG